MSKPRLLLTVSLIFNVILVAWAVLPGAASRDGPSAATPTAEPPTSRLTSWFAKLASPSGPTPAAPPDPVPDAEYSEAGWTRSLYDDVAELRGRGFDDATVRMLALAEAERLFRERAQAVLAPRQRTEYWEPRRQWLRVEPAQLATFQRLRREKIAAIEQLVGPDAVSTEGNTPQTFMVGPLTSLDYLPIEKKLALTEYLETSASEFQASTNPLTGLRGGGASSMRANHAEHEVARDTQIRLILGPELYEEYLKRSSQTAQRLRSQLTAFKPTRAEFDALVAIEHEHHARRVEASAFSAGMGRDKMHTMVDQRSNAVRAALGEQRYAEYQRSRNHSVVMLDRLVTELRLGPEAARASVELIEQAQAKTRALMSRRVPSPGPAVEQQLKATSQQLRRDLAATLGLEGLSENELNMLLSGMDAFTLMGPYYE